MAIQPPAGAGDDSTAIGLGARWQFGCFELNEKRGELRRDGVLVKIETKPLNLLMLFVRHPGELITKNDLINALWPGGDASDAMLGGCIARLRTALGDDGSNLIRNVFGHGYRFDGEVKLVEQQVYRAPSKVEFRPDDTPPLRPNWRLVRRLGLSGDCWLAEHAKTRQRRVFKFSNEPAGLAALKREVTIYRLLRESLVDRPCYVDLLDWNFDAAPWFIESEHCAGGSLQEWFTAQGGIDRVPLSTRIDLMIQIAEAVAAVHAVGVLHKDLKPANVFVVLDADGRPGIRLADFGASTLHDSAFLHRLEITRAGFTQVLDGSSQSGTLLSLAPEVVAGQPATIKADIYALGLMLYQVVAGALGRQLSTGWEAEIDDELLREDIAAATDGNPERRLAEAGELARRLRRLDARRAEQVAARAQQREAEEAARRRDRARARRAGMIAAVASLVIGLIGTTAFAWRANEARKLAEFEATRARVVGEFLAGGLFANISDDVRQVRDMPIKELLDRAAARIPAQYASDPDTKRDLHLALAKAYWSLDYIVESDAQFAAADALIVEYSGAADERRLPIAAQRIVASHVIGRLRDDIERFERLATQIVPKTDEGRLASRELQRELIRGRMFLGQSDLAKKRAEQLLPSASTADPEDQIGLWRLQGLAELNLLEVHKARQTFARALDARRKQSGERSRRLIPVLSNLALAEIESGYLDDAEAHLREARGIAQEWLRESSGWRDTVTACGAMLAHHRGDHETAIRDLRDVIERSRLDAPENPDGAITEYAALLASVYNDIGRSADARVLLDGVLRHQESALPANAIDLLRLRMEMARALIGTGDQQIARKLMVDARSVVAELLPIEHPFALQLAAVAADADGQRFEEASKRKLAGFFYDRHPLLTSFQADRAVAAAD